MVPPAVSVEGAPPDADVTCLSHSSAKLRLILIKNPGFIYRNIMSSGPCINCDRIAKNLFFSAYMFVCLVFFSNEINGPKPAQEYIAINYGLIIILLNI